MLPMLKKICHQKEERSFYIRNKKIPLCSRCLGFYTGLIVGIFLYYYIFSSFSIWNITVLLLITTFPFTLDGITQYFYKRESNNILRLLTGLLCGFGIGISLAWVLSNY